MRNEGLPHTATMVTTYGDRGDLGQGPTVAASAVWRRGTPEESGLSPLAVSEGRRGASQRGEAEQGGVLAPQIRHARPLQVD